MLWNYLQNYTVRSLGWRGTSETATGRAMAALSPALLSGSFVVQSDIHTVLNLKELLVSPIPVKNRKSLLLLYQRIN
jgi:hypothetical protein